MLHKISMKDILKVYSCNRCGKIDYSADGGTRTPERSRAPAFSVETCTLEAGVLPARLHLRD